MPEFVGVDLASFLLVEDAKHLPQFPLVLVVLNLLPEDSAEFVILDVPSACTE